MKGMVLEKRNGQAVVLCKDGSFSQVRDRNYTVGQEIHFSTVPYKMYLSMAACLMLVCTAAFGAHQIYWTPTSYVYVDINPSLRLDLNCFDRVIDVVPLNGDAEKLILSTNIQTKTTNECINSIVTACREQQYLNESNTDVEISVLTEHTKLKQTVIDVTETLQREALQVSVYNLAPEENQRALDLLISGKKLRAVRAYTDLFGGSIVSNAETLQDMSADEINDVVRKYRKSSKKQDETGGAKTGNDIVNNGSSADVNENEGENRRPQKDRHEIVDSDTEHAAENGDLAETSAQSSSEERNPKESYTVKPTSEIPNKRHGVIEKYPEVFGGTVRKNDKILKDMSVD